MRSVVLLALLTACKDKDEGGPEDTGTVPDPPPLAVPYVAFVTAIDQSAGGLKSTCEFGLEVYDADGNTLGSAESGGTGRQWAAVQIEEGANLTAKAIWQACTNYEDGTGEMTTSTFSADAGDMLVFHYNAYGTQFDTLHQETDFEGGVVEAEFDEGLDPTERVAGLPVSTEAVDATHWRFTWEDTTSPAQVLAALSDGQGYVSGSPVWIATPSWW